MLFGAVFGAVLGPLVFGPLFAGKELDADALVVPWLAAGAIMVVGLALAFLRPARPEHDRGVARDDASRRDAAAPLRADDPRGRACRPRSWPRVASFAVMVGVMNLTGYVASDHGHEQGDVFPIISAHIVGMYGARARRRRPRRPHRPPAARSSAGCS